MPPARALLAAFFAFAGSLHFARPRPYEAIVPTALQPWKKDLVAVSGAAEMVGAALVVSPASRRVGRWWLIALLAAVFPANVHMAVSPEQIEGLDTGKIPRWLLWLRLPVQPLLMLWVWRTTR